MPDDEIRALLVRLPKGCMLPSPPGTVAILQARVSEAEADLDEVTAWVQDHDGSVERTRPIKARAVAAGRHADREVPPQTFSVVPRSALSE